MSYSLLPLATSSASLLNQTADITTANLIASATAGFYRVSMYLVDSTADLTAGAVTAKVGYTDVSQAQVGSTAAVVLTTLGAFTNSIFFIQVVNATAISYATTHTGIFGSAKYNLYVSVEKLT